MCRVIVCGVSCRVRGRQVSWDSAVLAVTVVVAAIAVTMMNLIVDIVDAHLDPVCAFAARTSG
jgi:hypothetical protein